MMQSLSLYPLVPQTFRWAADKTIHADQQSTIANEPLRFETVNAAVNHDDVV